MTRKDYVAIAAAIRTVVVQTTDARKILEAAGKTASAHHADGKLSGAYAIAHVLADVMERDNPRFDRAKFIAATGAY